MTNVVQIGKHEYIHVMDENTLAIRLVCGPQTFIKMAHETVVKHCTKMIEVHPMHYCTIRNPVFMTEDGPEYLSDGK